MFSLHLTTARHILAAGPAAAGSASLTMTELGAAIAITSSLVTAVVALWRLDRAGLVERVKEATAEAEKNETRYEQATERYHAAVAELAAVKADLAREQGRSEGRTPLPPPSRRGR